MAEGLLKALKRRGKNSIAICPKCGNLMVHQLSSLGGWLTPPIYICEKCGYTGPILLEIDKETGVVQGKGLEGEKPLGELD